MQNRQEADNPENNPKSRVAVRIGPPLGMEIKQGTEHHSNERLPLEQLQIMAALSFSSDSSIWIRLRWGPQHSWAGSVDRRLLFSGHASSTPQSRRALTTPGPIRCR